MYEDKGYLKINRRFFKHFLWEEKRPLSKAEAWLDLLASARYVDEMKKEVIDGKRCEWGRGQWIASVRFLMKRWNWSSRTRVTTFLSMLQREEMITIDRDFGIQRITIENYEKYNAERKKKTEEFETDSPEYQASLMLYTLIKTRDEKFKQPDLQSWSKHIDLLIRIDNRTVEEIIKVIKFSQEDAFWRCNILSTAKLRKQFSKLLLKEKNGKTTNSSKFRRGDTSVSQIKEELDNAFGEGGQDNTGIFN
jgi:hypothetical protein